MLFMLIILGGCMSQAQDSLFLQNTIPDINYVECCSNSAGQTFCISAGNNMVQYHLLNKEDSLIFTSKTGSGNYGSGSIPMYHDVILTGEKTFSHLRVELGGLLFKSDGKAVLNATDPTTGGIKRTEIDIFPPEKISNKKILGFHAVDSTFYVVWMINRGQTLRVSSVDVTGKVKQAVCKPRTDPDILLPFATKSFRNDMELSYYRSSDRTPIHNPFDGFSNASIYIVQGKIVLVRENIKAKNKKNPIQTEVMFIDLNNECSFDFFYVPLAGRTYLTERSFWFYKRKDKYNNSAYLLRHNLASFLQSLGNNKPEYSIGLYRNSDNRFPIVHSSCKKYKRLKKVYQSLETLESDKFSEIVDNVLAPSSSAPYLTVKSEGNIDVISLGSIQSNNVYLTNPNAPLGGAPKTGKWIWNMNLMFDLKKNDFVPIAPNYATLWEQAQAKRLASNNQHYISSMFQKGDDWFTVYTYNDGRPLFIKKLIQ